MLYSDFIAFPAGSMTGTLELATLSELHGNGTVGAVVASSAQVEFTIVFRTQSAGAHMNSGVIAGNEYDHEVTNDTVLWNLTVN